MGIAKQGLLFDDSPDEGDAKYTKKIEAPVYEPSHAKPHLLSLCDTTKAKRLLLDIEESSLREDEKEFLRHAATRHIVFHYERIADYYAYSTPEMQRLMERSALVIIDFDQAIELGYVRLCTEIKKQFMEEYASEG